MDDDLSPGGCGCLVAVILGGLMWGMVALALGWLSAAAGAGS